MNAPRRVEAAIEDHIRSFFSGRDVNALADVDFGERLPTLRIFEVEPSEHVGLWTYISCGAWQIRRDTGARMEFFLLAPEQSARPAQLLRMTAWYHADPDASHQLDWGHTLPIGEPWLERSTCDVLLVSKPYTLGPAFELLDVDEDTQIHFYWLLPITDSERMYRESHGLDALEDRFQNAGLAYWNPDRPSAV